MSREYHSKTLPGIRVVTVSECSPAFDCEEEASALITDGVSEMLTLDSPKGSLLMLLLLVAPAG